MATDTVTLTIEADGDAEEVELPSRLVDMLREDQDESDADVVADVTMMSFAQRIHTAVHHAEGEPSDEIAEVDDTMMSLFEDRFGQSFGELTGHSH